ncbi:MAG: hypothetical protein METHP_01698 [Methanoregula sp. SKADARSKE-2]|nr:MAG: hypothetical protein METHP_01698 [Methanoregula sp. SKADARSKE-2]
MKDRIEELIDKLRVPPEKIFDLQKDYDPGYIDDFLKKEESDATIAAGIKQLAELQDKLYAQKTYALLIVLQAMDAAGKDSTIKHVMSGVNPQGVEVTSFKEPSAEELEHNFLWRNMRLLPRRGRIGIFNRSYYEEVLVVRVHPELLGNEHIPAYLLDKNIWNRRFDEINCFEKHLLDNGIVVVKIFLNVSKGVQKKRFLDRVDEPTKNWKFSAHDIRERKCWDAYMAAYQEMILKTGTPDAPWYIIPADHKWFTRLAVTAVIIKTLEKLNLSYPVVSSEQKEALLVAKAEMLAEDGGGDPAPAGKRGAKKKGR